MLNMKMTMDITLTFSRAGNQGYDRKQTVDLDGFTKTLAKISPTQELHQAFQTTKGNLLCVSQKKFFFSPVRLAE